MPPLHRCFKASPMDLWVFVPNLRVKLIGLLGAGQINSDGYSEREDEKHCPDVRPNHERQDYDGDERQSAHPVKLIPGDRVAKSCHRLTWMATGRLRFESGRANRARR